MPYFTGFLAPQISKKIGFFRKTAVIIGIIAVIIGIWADNNIPGWIAKVTSSLHDLLPVSQQSCKTKFRESSVTPESRKLILQTLHKPEFTLTKKLNIVSGYVSIETYRTPSPKNGHAKRRSKQFCKICKSYFHPWKRIYSEWRQLVFTS